jgi:hypothetical protein
MRYLKGEIALVSDDKRELTLALPTSTQPVESSERLGSIDRCGLRGAFHNLFEP